MALVRQEHHSFDILEKSVANGAQDVFGDHLHYECGGPVVCFSVISQERKNMIMACLTTNIGVFLL